MAGLEHSQRPEVARKTREGVRPIRFPYVLMTKADIAWINTLASRGIQFMTGGWLQISGSEEIEGRRVSRMKLVPDLPAAIRMQDHILQRYGALQPAPGTERERLRTITAVLKRADDIFARWARYRPRSRERLQHELLDVFFSLELCRNRFKAELREQADKASDLEDALGRNNPGVMRARLVAALTRISDRLSEIEAIAPRIAFRRELLVLEQSRSESCLESALGKLTLASRVSVFTAANEAAALRQTNPMTYQAVDRYLGSALYYLENVYASPFYEHAIATRQVIAHARALMVSPNHLVQNRRAIGEHISRAASFLREQPRLPGF